MRHSASHRRRLAITSALGAPTVLALLLLGFVESWRVRQPDTAIETTPFVYSLADAIARDDVVRAHEFIRAGQDPNEPVLVHDAVLTGARETYVAPIVWAAAHGSHDTVRMLLGYGARAVAPETRQAACLARRLGHDSVASLLERQAGDRPVDCGGVQDALRPGGEPAPSALDAVSAPPP